MHSHVLILLLSTASAVAYVSTPARRLASPRAAVDMSTRYRPPRRRAGGGGSQDRDLSRHNKVIERFLVQRAVQTQIYYLEQARDCPSANFIAEFMDHAGIDTFHGFDGLRVEPEEYIGHLLSSPPTTVQVRVSYGAVSWRGSPGNPYLNKEPKQQYEDFTIYPDRIGKAVLKIRDQIAREVREDLNRIAAEDDDLWVKRRVAVSERAPFAPPPPLDTSCFPDSTPTRRDTYDLLKKLTLHVSVKQTLRDMSLERTGDDLLPQHLWLEQVFAQSGFLAGDQGIGAADQFLECVLDKDIKLLSAGDGEQPVIIDPHSIVNQILDCRKLITSHYRDHLAGEREDDHDYYIRKQLERNLASALEVTKERSDDEER